MKSKNSYSSLKKLTVGSKNYNIYSIPEAEKNGLSGVSKLPKSLKVLLENLLRFEDDLSVKKDQITAIQAWLQTKHLILRLHTVLQEYFYKIILEFQRLQILLL